MAGDEEHRWLGYQPLLGDGFIAVCSCGWRSPAQHTAGVAGALLDAHRDAARETPRKPLNSSPACASPGTTDGDGD